MRILWVKLGGLWPPTAGGRIRSLETLSCLSRHHDVTVVTTHGPGDDPGGLVRRLPHCRIVSVPFVAPRAGTWPFMRALASSLCTPHPVDLWKWRAKAVRDEVRARLAGGAIDVCVADFLVAVANIPAAPRVPVVLFEHNVEHLIWQRVARLERRPWRRALLEIEARKVRRAERRACAAADLVVAVSEDDRRRLQALAPGSRCVATPTGVDVDYFQAATPRREDPHRLVFTGSMDWFPNEDAILFFLDAILPRIQAQVPAVTLSVVGRNPSARLRAAADRAGVVVTGTVDDVRPYVDEAAVYIVPLRAGGGTRLKIFEALAMGKAVVSTRVGAEGLDLTPGRDVAIADQPDEFAQTVIALLCDPGRREALGRAGRLLVQRRYSWEQVSKEFDRCCQSAALIRDARSGTPLALKARQSSS